MSAAQHTATPWHLIDCGRDGWKIYAPGTGVVAVMPAWAANDELRAEQAKNALLLWTAPDMLATLLWASETLTELGALPELRERIDAVIAKARSA